MQRRDWWLSQGKEVEEWVKSGKGVNGMVLGGNQTYYGDHFVGHANINLLSSTPETNKMVQTSFT